MRCPICGNVEFLVSKEEVDIGVGVQEHIIGGECKTCGYVGICEFCGVWENPKGTINHYRWCESREVCE